MRILYLADIRFPLERANGIQTMETCHALAGSHMVDLVVRPDTHDPQRDPYVYYGLPRVDGLRIERAPLTGPQFAKRLGYLAFVLGRALGGTRPDVVYTRDLGVASFLLRLPASLRPPVVYESHGYAPDVAAAMPELLNAPPPSKSKLSRLASREALVWRLADGYVTITNGLAEDLAARFGAREELAVIPDGVRLTTQDTPTAVSERPVVGYAGHLYPWKGVDVLVDALALVPEVDGLIVGGHEQESDLGRVRASIARLGLETRVRCTGQVEPSAVPALLRQASMLALPNPASAISTRYTSPLKLFEYMAAGRPIVASNLPSIAEVLEDGRNAILVAPGDPAALAAAIRRLAADPDLRERLAAAARHDVAAYGWDRRAARISALLDRVTAAAR